MKNQNPKTAKKDKASTKTKAAERPRADPKEGKKLAEQLKAFKEMLLKKKTLLANHLKTELSALEAPDKHHLADLEEMASDTHDTDSLCEIMAVGANTIDQIDLALAKIEEGTYGVCEDCGEHIAYERLEALPFATLCIECKKRREVIRS
jgi:DnaK suppressor protein